MQLYDEQQVIFALRRKGHKLMQRVFGDDKQASYRWRSQKFGNIHFADMNKLQLLTVIKELKNILKESKK